MEHTHNDRKQYQLVRQTLMWINMTSISGLFLMLMLFVLYFYE